MLDIEKLGLLLKNAIDALGKKLDALSFDIKNQKPPVINVPTPNVTIDKIEIPEIKLPAYPDFPEIPTPIVNVPKADTPIVNVAAPIVNVPPANITVTPAPVEIPNIFQIEGMETLIENTAKPILAGSVFDEVSSKKPLSTVIIGKDGKAITDFGGQFSAPSIVGIKNAGTGLLHENASVINPATEDTLKNIPGLSVPVHDYISLSYTGSNLTGVVYKTGGASGTTVATLTLGYSGSNLISVTKT